MGRVALDNPRFDSVGKDAAEKTDGTRGRSSAASDDGLSAQLLGAPLRSPFSQEEHFVLQTDAYPQTETAALTCSRE